MLPRLLLRLAKLPPRGHAAAPWIGVFLVPFVAGALLAGACQRSDTKPPDVPTVPTVRLYVTSTLAGALEPCGCRKDMLGGVDHAAALVAKGKGEAPHSLLLAAGPTLFMNPELSDEKRAQDTWKAEGIAEALAEMGLVAFTPGANDFAGGSALLSSLSQKARTKLVAGNLAGEGLAPVRTHFVEVAGQRVGIAGVSHPKSPLGLPRGVEVGELESALARDLAELTAGGATIKIALVASERGAALRLAERVPGFHVMIVGKSFDRGEGNDAPTAPILIGTTLVVEAPNHLQAMGVVDLYVRGDASRFQDAAGLTEAEERLSLERRVGELSRRIVEWERSGVSPADVAQRKADLAQMQARLLALRPPEPPRTGSFFRYTLSEVREGLGSDEKVGQRMSAYYRRVNEHNQETFKDRRPKPVAQGESSYVGIDACVECHEDAVTFWKGTGHSAAYKTLSDDFKEFNLDCVSCHVTGYERPGGSTVTFVEKLKDVQCEECHGPGSRHVETEEASFVTLRPDKELCVKCHHPPHVADDWSAEEAWQHVVGKGHGEGSKL